MDFFTSDTHYHHRNILKLCSRPFADLDEMHAALIDNWNARVNKTDTVYHLGDFCFDGHKKAFEIIEQLNGIIKFVPGGHDKWARGYLSITGRVSFLPPLYSLEYKDRGVDGYPLVIVLCHYPLLSWDRSCHRSISLHGHSHGNLKNEPPRSMDVGVDCHNYAPINLDDVLAKLTAT